MKLKAISLDGGSARTNAKTAAIASRVRYIITPSHDTKAGAAASKPWLARASAADVRSKSIGTKTTLSGTGTAARARRARLSA